MALDGKTPRPVGLLVNARNGSSIADWGKANANNTNLYAQTLARAISARRWGTLKGIIWHQGESDAWQASAYISLLKNWVNSFRADLNDINNDIYFLAGEIAYWRQSGTSSAFTAAIQTIADHIPNADWVSADGLVPYVNESDPHFNRESAIILGERYAQKVIRKFYGNATHLNAEPADQTSGVGYTLNGRQLSISDAGASSRIRIFDICGRTILSNTLVSQPTNYTFAHPGSYILSVNGHDRTYTTKIYVK
jgi:hypothetical protein